MLQIGVIDERVVAALFTRTSRPLVRTGSVDHGPDLAVIADVGFAQNRRTPACEPRQRCSRRPGSGNNDRHRQPSRAKRIAVARPMPVPNRSPEHFAIRGTHRAIPLTVVPAASARPQEIVQFGSGEPGRAMSTSDRKVALVTGSATGIGGDAIRFAGKGCRCGQLFPLPGDAEQTLAEVRKLGVPAILCKANVGDDGEVGHDRPCRRLGASTSW